MITKYNSIYFVGAGGIGMAALERFFLSLGKKVAGYDRTPTELTRKLIEEGVEIVFDENANLIPDYCLDKESTLVVYTPAVPQSHEGLQYFTANGFTIMKRAQVLGLITASSKGICFAGTHGKTTTSSMAGHILHNSAVGCNAFLGGVLKPYNSNLLLSPGTEYSVIEADEFDRSFHWLKPYIAVITATDPDHLDIYGTEEAYLESFAHFTELVRPDGHLITHTGLKLKARPAEGVTVYSYSRDEGDFHAENIKKGNGEITFDFVHPKGTITNVSLGVPVDINIDNAIASMAACWLAGAADDELSNGIATYQGAKRRFDFWLKQADMPVVIDDYAHHPDELRASIRSVKELYPDRRLTVIFQPHLYSRTRDFAPQFAQALSDADEVWLTEIYPARELPIPGVTSEIILNDIKCDNKSICEKKHLIERIKNHNFDVLLTVGAGDVCDFLPQICDILQKKC
ncbi:MAG: UDP-N-acetylmuramate--L-alanine ligase [Bacteroidales bacterium]|nr:UDP-N-acetylmuramate--L-alanine ligase [Bacteroidales bacterium]